MLIDRKDRIKTTKGSSFRREFVNEGRSAAGEEMDLLQSGRRGARWPRWESQLGFVTKRAGRMGSQTLPWSANKSENVMKGSPRESRSQARKAKVQRMWLRPNMIVMTNLEKAGRIRREFILP